jgi:pyrophosphatase PpaX
MAEQLPAEGRNEEEAPRATAFDVVLFDLDGTLINTNDLILTSFKHTFKAVLKLEVDDAAITPVFGKPLHVCFQGWTSDAAQVDELVRVYREFNVAQHDALVRRIEGVQEAVAAMHASGVRMAIVTSKLSSVARMGLRVCGLDGYFGVLVGMDHTSEHKPRPEPALHALAQLGASPGPRVLLVGDAPPDILCGRSAGCATCAVGWTVLGQDSLRGAGPDHWVDTPKELERLVLGGSG